MRSTLSAIFVLALTTPLAAQTPKPEELQKPNKEFAAAVNTKDFPRLMATYTDDAVVMPPNGPAITGKVKIEAFWKEIIDQGMRVESLTSTGAGGSGAWGHDSGIVELRFAPAYGSPVMDTIKYVTVLQRGTDGVWRISRDIWNSDLPAGSGK